MALPWGVKADVDPNQAALVTDFFEQAKGKVFTLPSNNVVEVLAAGVREKKGNYFLLFRYVITERP